MIGTRHDSHAEIAAAALRAGKAVFVEKPLGLTREEIDDVWEAGRDNDRLAIGFNRPFAPLAAAPATRSSTRSRARPMLVYRVNAPLARRPLAQRPARRAAGGILGEACHMFDFANWLCGTPLRVHGGRAAGAADVASVESATRHDRVRERLGRHRPLLGRRAPARCPRSASRSCAAGARGCSTTSAR